MYFQEFTDKMKEIQNKFLEFVEKEDNVEENYQNLITIISKHKIKTNIYELKSFIYMISKIANNHCRRPGFFDKIEQVLKFISESMKNFFTNFEIYELFQKNKMILLFLIQEKILIIDKYISQKMIKNKRINASTFFKPEIDPFLLDDTNSMQNDQKLPENFYENRKIGENHNYICKLIREDLIDDFITFVNKNDYSLNSKIETSIYETNNLLLANSGKVTLIEYAAFFGSVQIFKYLYLNGAKLNTFIWAFAIHSDTPEMINLLEESKAISFYEDYLKDAIKCHHNDIANYIISNLLDEKINIQIDNNEVLTHYSFHYYNFQYFPKETNNDYVLYDACEFDYFKIVEHIFKTSNIDLNSSKIFN